MFYFWFPSIMYFNWPLVAAAVIPAIVLLVWTYKSDRVEKEPKELLFSLVRAGILSSLLALVEERVLCLLLDLCLPSENVLYNVILYFGIVAFAEESSKYIFLKRRTWRSPEFNCRYDGLVYAVFVSLGFALWENISYVMSYGFATAIVRAVTAIPGHACFGVFMGVFYGLARQQENAGNKTGSAVFRVLAVVAPAVLHGTYDYIASGDYEFWFFAGFVAVLFAGSFLLVKLFSKADAKIANQEWQ